LEKEAIFNTFYKAKHLSFGCFLFWLYTICWGLETIQKIRHVGSDFFYTGFGQPTKKGATCQLNRNLFLPGLKDVKINKAEICEHSIHLYVEMPVKPHRCPRCGAEVRKIHDYRIQKIQHFKWFERPTVLFYRKRRYTCQTCGKRFAEENPFVERYQVEPGRECAKHSCQNVQRPGFPVWGLGFDGDPAF